jgi:hypothetical protein
MAMAEIVAGLLTSHSRLVTGGPEQRERFYCL